MLEIVDTSKRSITLTGGGVAEITLQLDIAFTRKNSTILSSISALALDGKASVPRSSSFSWWPWR